MVKRDINAEANAFKRREIDAALLLVTDKERAFFHKIFPRGVPDADLTGAFNLIQRTIDANERDAASKKGR
jgi:hypothetical protein